MVQVFDRTILGAEFVLSRHSILEILKHFILWVSILLFFLLYHGFVESGSLALSLCRGHLVVIIGIAELIVLFTIACADARTLSK